MTAESEPSSLRLPLLPRRARITLAIAAAAILLYFSIVPPPGTGGGSLGPFSVLPQSVWLHFISYGGLAGLLAYANYHRCRSPRRYLLVIFAVTVGIGLGIELIQLAYPTRTFSVFDILTNASGALVGLASWHILDQFVDFYPLADSA